MESIKKIDKELLPFLVLKKEILVSIIENIDNKLNKFFIRRSEKDILEYQKGKAKKSLNRIKICISLFE